MKNKLETTRVVSEGEEERTCITGAPKTEEEEQEQLQDGRGSKVEEKRLEGYEGNNQTYRREERGYLYARRSSSLGQRVEDVFTARRNQGWDKDMQEMSGQNRERERVAFTARRQKEILNKEGRYHCQVSIINRVILPT